LLHLLTSGYVLWHIAPLRPLLQTCSDWGTPDINAFEFADGHAYELDLEQYH
jgi:hypothetical protein